MITAIKTATRQKHIPLNSAVSLSRPVFFEDEDDRTLVDTLAGTDITDPVEVVIGLEEMMSLTDSVRDTLSVLEQQVLERFAPWCRGLEQAGLQQERRPLRLQVAELGWQWLDDTTLALEFQLPRGAYATAVVRELMQVGDEGATSHPGSPE